MNAPGITAPERTSPKGNAAVPALSLRDVRKNFGATEIIRGVTLDIAPGERHCIIGPNGAGKTTCFNLISGRFPITSGEILLNGERIDRLPPHRINRLGLSRSFQITSIFHRLSVFENLRCALLWSNGYRYSFWSPLWRQKALNEAGRRPARGTQPHRATRRPGRSALIRRTTRAGDRHDHRRRRVGGAAGRTNRGHEQYRNRLRDGADPPRHPGQNPADGRARHESRLRPRRYHYGAGLRPSDRLGTAGRSAGKPSGAGSLSRGNMASRP